MSDSVMTGAIEAAIRLLADCPTFRNVTGTTSQADAMDNIYRNGWPLPLDRTDGYSAEEYRAYRPSALVFFHPESFTARQVAHDEWEAGGAVVLRIERHAADTYRNEPTTDAMTAWEDQVSTLIGELADRNGHAETDDTAYLLFDEIRVDGPYCSDPDELAEDEPVWQGVEITLDFGGDR